MNKYAVFAVVALLSSIGPAAAQSSVTGPRKPVNQAGSPTATNPVVAPPAARPLLPTKPAASAPQPRPAH